jgi:ribonuclease P protein component
MKKINILKNSRDFSRIIKENKSYKSKYFFIYTEKTEETYHFGISVSKKIGNAVVRNKYKRQIRSIISKNNYKKGFNCIIILRKSAIDVEYKELEKDLLTAISKLLLEEEK